VRLPGQTVGVGEKLIAQLGVLPADGLDLGTVSPWHMLSPYPTVRPEDRAEGPELEPAGVQLRSLGDGVEEAAHVGSPEGYPGQAGVESQWNLCFEGGEIVVDVARPARRPEPLHPGCSGSAEQEHALIRANGRLALGKRLLAHAVVDVVEERTAASVEARRSRRPLPAVEPPAGHAEPHELAMGGPPPGPGLRVGEVDVS